MGETRRNVTVLSVVGYCKDGSDTSRHHKVRNRTVSWQLKFAPNCPNLYAVYPANPAMKSYPADSSFSDIGNRFRLELAKKIL